MAHGNSTLKAVLPRVEQDPKTVNPNLAAAAVVGALMVDSAAERDDIVRSLAKGLVEEAFRRAASLGMRLGREAAAQAIRSNLNMPPQLGEFDFYPERSIEVAMNVFLAENADFFPDVVFTSEEVSDPWLESTSQKSTRK